MAEKRLRVLDFARGSAIICVCIDHALVWSGANQVYPLVASLAIWSVGPLLALAGATMYLAADKR
ncbi:hypothetical protein IJJ12_03125, partial [bacterium]|nr:hypothetical protein [bacterium]